MSSRSRRPRNKIKNVQAIFAELESEAMECEPFPYRFKDGTEVFLPNPWDLEPEDAEELLEDMGSNMKIREFLEKWFDEDTAEKILAEKRSMAYMTKWLALGLQYYARQFQSYMGSVGESTA